MAKPIRVLFLAADPSRSGSRLRLDKEAREIGEAIQKGREREALELITAWAVRTGDLQTALLQHEPQVVHFAGHGHESRGIFLEDDQGNPKSVGRQALTSLFAILKNAIRVVILNTCDSRPTIEGFSSFIDYTIGMNSRIGDEAAVVFAASFYRALAFGRTVTVAFDLAVNQLQIDGIPEDKTPVLFVRDGIDLHEPLCPTLDRDPEQSVMRDQPSTSISCTNSRIGSFNVAGDGATIIGTTIINRKDS